MITEKETQIVFSICEYLSYKGHFFWRQNNGGMYREGRFFALPKYAMRGIPDIILVKSGIFWGLEVKRQRSYQSREQKIFQKKCTEAGGIYHVVHSIDDVIALGL